MFGQPPIIIDCGSGTLKAGFATKEGQHGPTVEFPSIIGRPRHKSLNQIGGRPDAIFVGNEAEAKRGILKCSYPVEKGYVRNMQDTYLLWLEALRMLPDGMARVRDTGLVLTEPPLNSWKNREELVELALEKLQTAGVSLQVQGVLSLYSYGNITGTVCEIGDGVTHTIPVFDGFCLPHAVNRMDVGGRDCTSYLQKTLMDEGVSLTSSAEFEIARGIKEKYCKISQKFASDLEHKTGYERTSHTLPDGQIININSQQIRVPEILFDPAMIGYDEKGIHQMIADTIHKSDIDLRDELYSNVLLSGGSSMFPGMQTRLQDEVQKLIPSTMRASVKAERHRKFGAFIGGAMVASLPTFDEAMYITRQELQEYGPDVIARKSF